MKKLSSEQVKKWRGLSALVSDAIDQGTAAIERVHLATAQRTFNVLEQTPVAEPSSKVHDVHDSIVSTVYGTIRSVNQLVGKTLDTALESLAPSEPSAAQTEAQSGLQTDLQQKLQQDLQTNLPGSGGAST